MVIRNRVNDSFQHTTLPVLGNRVHRVGLACNFGIDDKGVETALEERGLGLVFWTPRQQGAEAIKRAMKRNRDGVVLLSGLCVLGFYFIVTGLIA